jgi:hypothetical protein
MVLTTSEIGSKMATICSETGGDHLEHSEVLKSPLKSFRYLGQYACCSEPPGAATQANRFGRDPKPLHAIFDGTGVRPNVIYSLTTPPFPVRLSAISSTIQRSPNPLSNHFAISASMLAIRGLLVLLALVGTFGGANALPSWAAIKAKVLEDMPRIAALRGWHTLPGRMLQSTSLSSCSMRTNTPTVSICMFGFTGNGYTYLSNAMSVLNHAMHMGPAPPMHIASLLPPNPWAALENIGISLQKCRDIFPPKI